MSILFDSIELKRSFVLNIDRLFGEWHGVQHWTHIILLYKILVDFQAGENLSVTPTFSIVIGIIIVCFR